MIDFVAIDFETANPVRNSACSVGIAVVKNGQIVHTFESLIKPPQQEFHPINVEIHGISYEMVQDAPTFSELWGSVEDFFHGSFIAAHNLPFDKSVLIACLQEYNLAEPDILGGLCTLQMSRRCLGLADNKLPTVASHFGIPLGKHHSALHDAIACARIAISLHKLCDFANFVGKMKSSSDGKTRTESTFKSQYGKLNIPIAEPDNRFSGVAFIFTGELKSLNRREAKEIVQRFGGTSDGDSVTRKTTHLEPILLSKAGE